MRKAIQIVSYFLAGITTIGVLALAVDNELDIYSLVGWLIITVQSVLVLIYVNNKK